MTPLAVIPIRSGSKGLPNKNVLFFRGKPLVCQTIQALIDSKIIDDSEIFVSTDSIDYITLLNQYYPSIQYHLRPASLAMDESTTADFLTDFLNRFDSTRDFILCQATSPLRTGEQIRQAYNQFTAAVRGPVVSVKPVSEPEQLYTRINYENQLSDIVGIDKGYRRQAFEQKYLPNGAIYISNIGEYLKEKSFFLPTTEAFIMSPETSIDIDNVVDLDTAESIVDPNGIKRLRQYQTLVIQAQSAQFAIQEKLYLSDGRDLDRLKSYQISGFFCPQETQMCTLEDLCSLITSWPKISPTEIVLSAGTYDLLNQEPEEIIDIFSRFVHTIHVMDWNGIIKVQQIAPVLYQAKIHNEAITRLNQGLKKACQENGIDFLDDEEQTIQKLDPGCTSDGLHFTRP